MSMAGAFGSAWHKFLQTKFGAGRRLDWPLPQPGGQVRNCRLGHITREALFVGGGNGMVPTLRAPKLQER